MGLKNEPDTETDNQDIKDNRNEQIGIIGLGYVGFPLALLCAKRGKKVIGFELNKDIINSVNAKQNHLKDHSLQEDIEKYTIQATDDFTKISECQIIIICVPTPVDNQKLPNLDYVTSSVKTVADNLSENTLVIIESTIYPGTCEDIIAPILDESKKKYYLAYCPERINPGDKKWNVSNINRVVGGINQESSEKAKIFYSSIIDGIITKLNSIKAAEAVKIMENTYRDVNIAYINEMALSFDTMGIDIKEVIKGASTKPFAFLAHYPGCGVGGHCIAVDPYYLIEKAKQNGFNHKFLSLARKINNNMPKYTVELLSKMLENNKKTVNGAVVGVLGLSYKKNVADDRESPAYAIIDELKKEGAIIIKYDPFFPEKSDVSDLKTFTEKCKYIILACDHSEFLTLSPEDLDKKGVEIFIDGKNAFDKDSFSDANIMYKGIGV